MPDESKPLHSPDALYSAASLYYLEDMNQAAVAKQLGTSRATISRMLAEARRTGIVRIEVVPIGSDDHSELAERTAEALGLEAVHLAPESSSGMLGASLAPVLSSVLGDVGLGRGDVLLLGSGRTIYGVTQSHLPSLPGVKVVPAIGGQSEPQAWYQSNEIMRQFASKIDGHPTFLHAPALPTAELYETLVRDPSLERVTRMWGRADCAVLGVGSPPLDRQSIPDFVPVDASTLLTAVGDVCSRFYDQDGEEVWFPGVEQLISTPLETVREIPVTIAVAVGKEKIGSLVAGAKGGYFNCLITDVPTAHGLVETVTQAESQAAT